MGVTCFGVHLPKISSTLTWNPKNGGMVQMIFLFQVRWFFCFLLYFPGCIFSWGGNSNTQNYNFGSISPPGLPELNIDPEALVKRVYAMEMLEVEPRLDWKVVLSDSLKLYSYQPVRPWKSMVGILPDWKFHGKSRASDDQMQICFWVGAKRPIFRCEKTIPFVSRSVSWSRCALNWGSSDPTGIIFEGASETQHFWGGIYLRISIYYEAHCIYCIYLPVSKGWTVGSLVFLFFHLLIRTWPFFF